jgi:hypothetical protein
MGNYTSEGERWRKMPLDEVADAAIDSTLQSHVRANAELQRRLIEESGRASRRLLIATCVIAILTAVLIAITILQLVGVLD